MYYTRFDSIICPITLIGDEKGLQHLHMHTGDERHPLLLEEHWVENADFFRDTVDQISAYLSGTSKVFDVTLNPQGTSFQLRAWEALKDIPYGETRTYGEQALLCGNPKASRAIGTANGRNPIPIIIPCHRVIGSNGKLTGFAFGLDVKIRLLELESNQTDTFS